MSTADWKSLLASRQDAHLRELVELLRIPSVSTDPARAGDVRAAAEVVSRRLRTAGVPIVDLIQTPLHPVVIGEWVIDDARPTVLIYGHYDVQPEEPVDLWETPAFEPAIREGKLYARGSSDMKGNLLTAIQGVETIATALGGAPPVNVKFLFEGEEEIGSPNLAPLLEAKRELLAADVVLSVDGGMEGPDTPSLTVSSKGLAACQIDLTTSTTDLHSGVYGHKLPQSRRLAAA